MGPHCRKRYGVSAEVTEEARAEANKLVYEIALDQKGKRVLQHVARLRELGFAKLAARIIKRVAPLEVEEEGDELLVRTPWDEQAVAMFRRIPGRRWDKDRKANVIPRASQAQLFALFKRCFPGALGLGRKGIFEIPTDAEQAA
jgi:hypothetical protein